MLNSEIDRRSFLLGAGALVASALVSRDSADGVLAGTEELADPDSAGAGVADGAPVVPERLLLPMSSGVDVSSGESVVIVSKICGPSHSFLSERILIGGCPDDWVVDEFIVDGKPQLPSGGLPGGEFLAEGGVYRRRFDVARHCSDLSISVTRVGSGASPFFCAVLGSAAWRQASSALSLGRRPVRTVTNHHATNHHAWWTSSFAR